MKTTILQLLAFCSLFVVSISFNQLNFVLLNKGSNRKLIFRSFSLPRRFFHVTTIEGHEKKLKDEIKSKVSDVKNIRIQKRGVSFEGSSRSGFESVLWLRTALKVMERIGSQQQAIRSKDDVYDYVQSINWDSIITVQNTIKCDAILSKYNADALNLTHSHFTALTIKNAIVDQFVNSKNDQSYRPNVDKENPDLPIIFYMHMNEPFIYRAWSGELSMHKRGYKTNAIHKAGLKETTAAGIILSSEWNPSVSGLVDPMCGSGTIPIEAALIMCNTAPGLIRYSLSNSSCFPVPMTWKDLTVEEKRTWFNAYQEALNQDRRKQFKGIQIFANDIHKKNIQYAEESAKIAGVNHLISFSNKNIVIYDPFSPSSSTSSTSSKPKSVLDHENSNNNNNNNNQKRKYTVITNPPWDTRLKLAETSWKRLNSFLLKHRRSIIQNVLLNGNPVLEHAIQCSLSKKIHINSSNRDLDILIYKNYE